ncbi:DUF4767 domain-containing protein [Lacticaseibacillus hegangensis]|uniref:DUF4767 domain-containing protein n=1 Tax=Lacticaseibacillus hegangensis TaxID=2486010 RepID=A0ABW4CVF1_9LACO|nr:DUF4767 domain-containing protein [Lacticaseibacillus hegangensis]
MKLWRTTILLTLGLALAACGTQQPKKAASSSSAVSSSSKKKAPTGVKLAWNSDKAQKLDAFMNDFGPTKNQSFTRAGRKSHTKWQGLDLSKVYAAKRPISINDKKTSVTWLPKDNHGSKTHQNVVAVYADDEAKVLFLFTLTAKKHTRVLISQEVPKGNVISTVDTTNDNVKKGFADIAAGRPATMTSKAVAASASATSSSTASSSSAAPAKSGHKPVFGSQFFHTWYTADQDQSPTLSFTANSITEDGVSQPVYDSSEESQSDLDIAQNAGDNPDPVRGSWGSASESADGTSVAVRGWYQANGGPAGYKIYTMNLGGQSTKVLETSEGAGWHVANYFLTQDLANQYQNQIFPGEPPTAY